MHRFEVIMDHNDRAPQAGEIYGLSVKMYGEKPTIQTRDFYGKSSGIIKKIKSSIHGDLSQTIHY